MSVLGYVRVFAVSTLLLNLLVVYLIVFATPKSLGNFRWHILTLHNFQMIFEFGIIYCEFPFLGLPAFVGFTVGLFTEFGIGIYWQMVFSSFVLFSMLSMVQLIVFSRHQAILPANHWLKLGKVARDLWIYSCYSLPAFCSLTMAVLLWSYDYHAALGKIENKYPYLSPFFHQPSSGQTNPSVTLVLWSLGRASIQQVLAYIPIQIFGAFVGTATAYLDYLETLNFYDGGRRQIDGPNGTLCFFVTCIAPYSTKLSALFDQIVGTAILCMTMAAMLDPKNGVPKFLHPLFGGLTVLTIGLAFAQNDAYPIHAARDLGARLFMFIIYGKGVWTKDDYYWWVPILGPLIGGFVGAWLYVLFIDFHAWSNREEDEVEL
ncbi:unnamed protein product, partial [Mesorhabditis belari]|uniref:Aquaporin-like protein n=1 Tax=Mesorhabditis belari TaxID=2138241 RepID=A0AAF3J885_9BILA